MSVRWGAAALAACVGAIAMAGVSAAAAEDFKANSTELLPPGKAYKNCSDAAGCGPGAGAPDLNPSGSGSEGWDKFKKHFTSVGKKVRVCDVIVYRLKAGIADHFVTVVGFTADGQPLTVGQNGDKAGADAPKTPANKVKGNVTLNTADTFENSGKQETDWEGFRANDDAGKELPKDLVDKSKAAEKGQPPKPGAEMKAWLAVWLACRERNYAAMGADATGKKESVTISRRQVIETPNAPQYVSAPQTPPGGGVYAGVEGGGRSTGGSEVTTTHTTTLGGPDTVLDPTLGLGGSGAVGGIYVGYTAPLSPSFVAQVELGGGGGDTSRTQTGIPGTAGIPVPGIVARIPNDSTTLKTTWDVHLLGRLGTRITPDTTLFVTGGGGWLRSETTINCTAAGVCGGIGVPAFSATSAATRAGWIVGAAVETAFMRGFKARLEYRHGDYGTRSASYGNPALLAVVADTKLVTDQVTVGLSYQFGVAPAFAPPQPAYSGPPMVVKAPALK